MDRQPSADCMGAGQPRLRKHGRIRVAPCFQQLRETPGEQGRESLRKHLLTKECGRAIRQSGCCREIDAEAHGNPVPVALQQGTGELSAVQHDVVRPFQHQRLPGSRDIDGLDQGKSGNERERLCRRIIISKLNERAAVEIAFRREPAPALTSATRLLIERDEPIAFDRASFGNQVGIGRAGALDDADAGQNRLPAALSVSAPKGPMRR